jgi:Flp pilus assembly protein CpaB
VPAPATAFPSVARAMARLPHRLRVVLATRPLAYWLLTALLAAALGYGTYGVVAAAERTRAGFGTLASTVVATDGIAPGEALSPVNTTTRVLPVAVLPPGSLTSVPAGAVANSFIAPGEPVLERRLGRAGDGPVAALLPDGGRGVAVPVDETSLPLRRGDQVDVVAAVGAGVDAGSTGRAQLVAKRARVADVGERAVVVAVDEAELPAVAQALVDGGVVLALSAGP